MNQNTAIPCGQCPRHLEGPDGAAWRAMLAAADFGHDRIGHRVYRSLVRRRVAVERIGELSDAQILSWPNTGAGLLARFRAVVPAPPAATGCALCEVLAGQVHADVVAQWSDAAVIVPPSPVCTGHVLVVAHQHVSHAVAAPELAGQLLARAAAFAAGWSESVNLITSVGRAATAGVEHLHIHIVPRTDGDGLLLPWSAPVDAPAGGGEVPSMLRLALACETCAPRVSDPADGRWRSLLAEVELGHDWVAHRAYAMLIRHGAVTADTIRALSDEQILAMRNSGGRALTRIRSYFPAAGATQLLAPAEWCARYGLEVSDPDGWRRAGADWQEPVSLPLFWARFSASTIRVPPIEVYRRVQADVRTALEAAR